MRAAPVQISPANAIETLRALYAGYVAYHGCKPEHPDCYLKEGLLAHERAVLNAAAKERILKHFPDLDARLIDQAIVEATPGGGRPEVCAFIDRRTFLQDEGRQFFELGSELPRRIATLLEERTAKRICPIFESVGVPTIVRIAVDWDDATDHVLGELAREVGDGLSQVRQGAEPRTLDVVHVQLDNVPPQRILELCEPAFE